MIRPGEKFSISRMEFLFRRGKSGGTISGKIPRSVDGEEDNFCNCKALRFLKNFLECFKDFEASLVEGQI